MSALEAVAPFYLCMSKAAEHVAGQGASSKLGSMLLSLCGYQEQQTRSMQKSPHLIPPTSQNSHTCLTLNRKWRNKACDHAGKLT